MHMRPFPIGAAVAFLIPPDGAEEPARESLVRSQQVALSRHVKIRSLPDDMLTRASRAEFGRRRSTSAG